MGLTTRLEPVDVFDDRWTPWLELDDEDVPVVPTLAQRLDISLLWEIKDEAGGCYLTDRYVLLAVNELPDPGDIAPVMQAHMSAPSALDAALRRPFSALLPLTTQTFDPWHLLVLEAVGIQIKAVDVPPLTPTHPVPCALVRNGRVIGLVQPRRNGVGGVRAPLAPAIASLAGLIYDSGDEVTRRVAVRAAAALRRHLHPDLTDEGTDRP